MFFFRPKLKIEMTNNDFRLRPTKAYKTDACFDVRVEHACLGGSVLLPGTHFIKLPFKVEFTKGYCLELVSKSGLSKEFGFIILNAPAQIDYGYPDQVCINFSINKKMKISHGMKIAQMKLVKLSNEKVEFGKISGKGDRAGGHGSTGKF